MYKIFFTVKNIFDYTFKNASAEFKDGFMKCYTLFEIGYEKAVMTPLKYDFKKVSKELDRVSAELVRERKLHEITKKKNQEMEEEIRQLISNQSKTIRKAG